MLLQINQVFVGVHDAVGLRAVAEASSIIKGSAQRVFKRVALDEENTFDLLRLGNLALVDEPRAGFNVAGGLGFQELVKIISMDYNDTSNIVSLNVELPSYYTGGARPPQDGNGGGLRMIVEGAS